MQPHTIPSIAPSYDGVGCIRIRSDCKDTPLLHPNVDRDVYAFDLTGNVTNTHVEFDLKYDFKWEFQRGRHVYDVLQECRC